MRAGKVTLGGLRRANIHASVIMTSTSDTLSPNAQVTYTGYFTKSKNRGMLIAPAIRSWVKLSYTFSMHV
jgi:hypothetical protein